MSRAKVRKMAARFHKPSLGVCVVRMARSLGITVTPTQENWLRTVYADPYVPFLIDGPIRYNSEPRIPDFAIANRFLFTSHINRPNAFVTVSTS